MRMLKQEGTGRTYVWHEQLASVEGMTEFDDPDFVNTPTHVFEPEQVEQPEAVNVVSPAPAQVAEPEEIPEQVEDPDPEEEGKPLEDMTSAELRTVAEQEAKIRGVEMKFRNWNKAQFIAFITGEGV